MKFTGLELWTLMGGWEVGRVRASRSGHAPSTVMVDSSQAYMCPKLKQDASRKPNVQLYSEFSNVKHKGERSGLPDPKPRFEK